MITVLLVVGLIVCAMLFWDILVIEKSTRTTRKYIKQVEHLIEETERFNLIAKKNLPETQAQEGDRK